MGGENQTWPGVALCAVLGGRLGKRHQQSPRLALLEACDPVASESGTTANLDERKPAPPRRRERAGKRKAEKEKSRLRRACKGDAWKHGMASMGK